MSSVRLNRKCPICESEFGTVLHTQRFAESSEIGSQAVVDIVSCDRCACGFSDLKIGQDELDRSYEEHSKYADMSVFGEVSDEDPRLNESPWDLTRLSSTASWISKHIPDRQARILDAGCATGTLIGLLSDHGFTNLVGLDPSPLAAATARKHYKVEAYAGSFCDPPSEIGRFDVIILSHVLEHIADVKSAANGLASMVDEGGLVYLEVPDASRYSDFLVAPYHDFNNEHVNHFSLQCLDTLLELRGFERVVGSSKEVPIAPDILYPAAFGLWRKSNQHGQSIPFDEVLRNSLERYVTASHKLLSRLDEWIRANVRDEPVALWGAGNLTLKLLASTSLSDKNVSAIVDGSTQRQGVALSGNLVRDPLELKDFEGTVIVMSLHHASSITRAATKIVGEQARVLRLFG